MLSLSWFVRRLAHSIGAQSEVESREMIAYRRLDTIEKFKSAMLKIAAITYERWLLRRGSDYSDFTSKNVVLWQSGIEKLDCTYFVGISPHIKFTACLLRLLLYCQD